jgi:hypothetical protein
MIVLTIGARRVAPTVLRGLWVTVPVIGAVLLLTWAVAYRGDEIDVVDPWVRGLLPALKADARTTAATRTISDRTRRMSSLAIGARRAPR